MSMPIYEYHCSACDRSLEKLQKVADPVLKDCPFCHQPTLSRVIGAPAVRLKGGGWYETDFKTDKDRKKNLHTSDTPKGSGSSTSE